MPFRGSLAAMTPLVRLAVALALTLGACTTPPAPPGPLTCDEMLFGAPNERTGLTAEQCAPRCACEGFAFEAPNYGPDDLAALRALTLLEPPALLATDPYDAPATPIDDEAVCAVVRPPGETTYTLRDYPSEADALADGAQPTHFGVCGLCSSLEDLAVYLEQPDLTEPVRACGLMFPRGPAEDHLACLRALGFTEPCAQIWYFNTLHTRERCLAPCVAALDEPYHLPDGSLNECILCDEVQSGPVFKAIAGRTRRNSGVASALCRPCREVRPIVHRY